MHKSDLQARTWYERPLRLVQTVLREIDAPDYDAERVVDYVQRIKGNALVINGGGLWAFYRTEHPLQRVIPGMKGDIVGEVVEAARARGIHVLVRVDFRGGPPSVYEAHPDWFAHDLHGVPRKIRGGLYAAPVLSPYRNEGYGFDVVREILENYDVSGIWENAPGFVHPGGEERPSAEDAEARYWRQLVPHDPHTRRAFRDATGEELPSGEDREDPVYRRFLKWRYTAMHQHAEALHGSSSRSGRTRPTWRSSRRCSPWSGAGLAHRTSSTSAGSGT